MESDTDYRLRIQQAFEGLSVAGSVGAYQYHGRSADGRVAISLSPVRLRPASPSLCCHVKITASHPEDLLAVVRNALNGEGRQAGGRPRDRAVCRHC